MYVLLSQGCEEARAGLCSVVHSERIRTQAGAQHAPPDHRALHVIEHWHRDPKTVGSHLWRSSAAGWTRPWASCSGWSIWSRAGPDGPKGTFPPLPSSDSPIPFQNSFSAGEDFCASHCLCFIQVLFLACFFHAQSWHHQPRFSAR